MKRVLIAVALVVTLLAATVSAASASGYWQHAVHSQNLSWG